MPCPLYAPPCCCSCVQKSMAGYDLDMLLALEAQGKWKARKLYLVGYRGHEGVCAWQLGGGNRRRVAASSAW